MVSKLEKQIKRLDIKEMPVTKLARQISSRLNIPFNTAYAYIYASRNGCTLAQYQWIFKKRKRKAQTPFEESIELRKPNEFLSIPDEKDYFSEYEQKDEVNFYFEQLTSVYKRTLERRFFENLTFMQVAEKEGVSYQTIEQREKKALKELRKIWYENQRIYFIKKIEKEKQNK